MHNSPAFLTEIWLKYSHFWGDIRYVEKFWYICNFCKQKSVYFSLRLMIWLKLICSFLLLEISTLFQFFFLFFFFRHLTWFILFLLMVNISTEIKFSTNRNPIFCLIPTELYIIVGRNYHFLNKPVKEPDACAAYSLSHKVDVTLIQAAQGTKKKKTSCRTLEDNFVANLVFLWFVQWIYPT